MESCIACVLSPINLLILFIFLFLNHRRSQKDRREQYEILSETKSEPASRNSFDGIPWTGGTNGVELAVRQQESGEGNDLCTSIRDLIARGEDIEVSISISSSFFFFLKSKLVHFSLCFRLQYL